MHSRVIIDIEAENGAFWAFVGSIYELMSDYGDFAMETCVCVIDSLEDEK